MKFYFLSSIIVLCLVIAHANKKHRRLLEKSQNDFWAREAKANATRKKPLDKLSYITIPFDSLPMDVLKEDDTVLEYHRLLSDLSTQKIVNFTGWTNTDLKLEYGTANITVLSDYDQNYTLLARTLQNWAEYLCKNNYYAESLQILEFALSTGSDVSRTFYLAADLYDHFGTPDKKESLREAATILRTPMKDAIVRTLQEAGPYTDLLHS